MPSSPLGDISSHMNERLSNSKEIAGTKAQVHPSSLCNGTAANTGSSPLSNENMSSTAVPAPLELQEKRQHNCSPSTSSFPDCENNPSHHHSTPDASTATNTTHNGIHSSTSGGSGSSASGSDSDSEGMGTPPERPLHLTLRLHRQPSVDGPERGREAVAAEGGRPAVVKVLFTDPVEDFMSRSRLNMTRVPEIPKAPQTGVAAASSDKDTACPFLTSSTAAVQAPSSAVAPAKATDTRNGSDPRSASSSRPRYDASRSSTGSLARSGGGSASPSLGRAAHAATAAPTREGSHTFFALSLEPSPPGVSTRGSGKGSLHTVDTAGTSDGAATLSLRKLSLDNSVSSPLAARSRAPSTGASPDLATPDSSFSLHDEEEGRDGRLGGGSGAVAWPAERSESSDSGLCDPLSDGSVCEGEEKCDGDGGE